RRLPVRRCRRHHVLHPARAVEHGELGMGMQVGESHRLWTTLWTSYSPVILARCPGRRFFGLETTPTVVSRPKEVRGTCRGGVGRARPGPASLRGEGRVGASARAGTGRPSAG